MNAEATRDRIAELNAGLADAPARSWRERLPASPRTLLVSALAIAVAVGGGGWLVAAPSTQSTDDAYVAADTTAVAPKVRGLVAQVLVRDNQNVKAGDPLVRIDSEEFDARAASAEADLANADAGVASARAAIVSQSAEEGLAAANIAASRTAIRASAAEVDRTEADRRRYDNLLSSGAVSRRDVDAYRTTAVQAEQAAARAGADLAVSERAASVTSAKRASLGAALDKALAQRQRAAAALDLARQDQRHTLIRAAVDGTVGNRLVRVGDYVQPGTRLLSLVPLHALYVTANFKETQVRDMLVGQKATIAVDALGGRLAGHVESFAPGSGSTFAMLPFEPGTGNFTKIVQRVPVRIRFDDGQAGVDRLRPGLSVTARVRVSE